MLDWRNELKKHVSKRIKEMTGEDVPIENIYTMELDTVLDYSEIPIEELASMYAFAIMKEDFEDAKKIADELKKRDVDVEIDIDEMKRTGVINFYLQPKKSIAYLDIKLKVLPDGLMIDFDNENII